MAPKKVSPKVKAANVPITKTIVKEDTSIKSEEAYANPSSSSASSKNTEKSASGLKQEKPDPKEQRNMLAKMHYLKKLGNSKAYDEYMQKDGNGKRAWYWEVYKTDPTLAKYSNVMKSRSIIRTGQSQ